MNSTGTRPGAGSGMLAPEFPPAGDFGSRLVRGSWWGGTSGVGQDARYTEPWRASAAASWSAFSCRILRRQPHVFWDIGRRLGRCDSCGLGCGSLFEPLGGFDAPRLEARHRARIGERVGAGPGRGSRDCQRASGSVWRRWARSSSARSGAQRPMARPKDSWVGRRSPAPGASIHCGGRERAGRTTGRGLAPCRQRSVAAAFHGARSHHRHRSTYQAVPAPAPFECPAPFDRRQLVAITAAGAALVEGEGAATAPTSGSGPPAGQISERVRSRSSSCQAERFQSARSAASSAASAASRSRTSSARNQSLLLREPSR
jgi:hypothetical protein